MQARAEGKGPLASATSQLHKQRVKVVGMNNDSVDISMQDVDEERKDDATPPLAAEEMGNASILEEDVSLSSANAHKPLPSSIIPPNKASTAPSQEVIERFAPGSAPHWVGPLAFLSKETVSEKAGKEVYIKG